MGWFAPASVPRSQQRWFRAGRVVYVMPLVAHVAFVPLFAALGIPALAAFNVVSVVCWAAALWLHRRGWLTSAVLVGNFELVAHALVASVLLGFASAYWVFLAALPQFVMVATGRRSATIGAVVAMVVLCVGMGWSTPMFGDGVAHELALTLGALNLATFLVMMVAVNMAQETTAAGLERELDAAHDATERLLHNTLPPAIAERLKGDARGLADAFPEVSVVFCDIVGFTTFASTVPPERLVAVLNAVFHRLDDLAAKHGLEKIKTIGDAYMAAAGVPVARADHALAAAAMAREIPSVLAEVNAAFGTSLSVRVGIHSGPVVAGVIGKHKWAYDLWGDTVNTASRMESHGVMGEVQLSDRTRELLADAYDLRDRGVIEVKGKGPTRVWLLGAPRGTA